MVSEKKLGDVLSSGELDPVGASGVDVDEVR